MNFYASGNICAITTLQPLNIQCQPQENSSKHQSPIATHHIYFNPQFQGIYQKACRSMSDGAASRNEEIFPSLPDSVLQKLGVLGSEIR